MRATAAIRKHGGASDWDRERGRYNAKVGNTQLPLVRCGGRERETEHCFAMVPRHSVAIAVLLLVTTNQSDATHPTYPTGSFIQPWLFRAWTVAEWTAEFAAYREVCMELSVCLSLCLSVCLSLCRPL